DGDAEAGRYQCAVCHQHRELRSTEWTPRENSLGAGAVPADPAATSCRAFTDQYDEGEQYENEREGTRRVGVEAVVELTEDLGRERLVAEYLERAVLGEHDERDEQASAEDGPPS